ncbi:MAG TPA: hypothetical protein VEC01_16780 [Noviherbaspirillum sp.]|uniref:hypothetical protein n=1 Tax=Noviherbaspirillum sp. TaxID=1926288 RepID=UPI002D6A476C|nr:hypothetical protein [Noviherbaspirillum sp.]HYD96986.1 hypothetical protein [Noviherbaspirillum sp.]
MKTLLAALALFAGFICTTHAQSQSEIGISGHVGTTGVGAHMSVPVAPNVNVRLGLGYLGYNYKGSTNGLAYDLDLKANTYDALMDWYPTQGSSFRVTGGLTYNANRINARGRPNAAGQYVIQGRLYNASDIGSVNGKVDFNKVAPYLGIGWGRQLKDEKGWSFSTDIGVLFQGSPKTSLSTSGCSAPAAVCNQFASDIARENAAFQSEVKKFKLYPVLRIGVSYKF